MFSKRSSPASSIGSNQICGQRCEGSLPFAVKVLRLRPARNRSYQSAPNPAYLKRPRFRPFFSSQPDIPAIMCTLASRSDMKTPTLCETARRRCGISPFHRASAWNCQHSVSAECRTSTPRYHRHSRPTIRLQVTPAVVSRVLIQLSMAIAATVSPSTRSFLQGTVGLAAISRKHRSNIAEMPTVHLEDSRSRCSSPLL